MSTPRQLHPPGLPSVPALAAALAFADLDGAKHWANAAELWAALGDTGRSDYRKLARVALALVEDAGKEAE